jgi:RNA polymerase sigma-70 factor, ECF subfamily
MDTIQSQGIVEVHPDVALVARAREGDLKAFETLVKQYDRQVFRIAQHITQNKEDAEDVVQDAFLKAYEKLHQFQGNSKFYTWLVRIAVNESLMRLRRRRTGKMVSIDEDVETEEGSMPRDLADSGTSSWIPGCIYVARYRRSFDRGNGGGAWIECPGGKVPPVAGETAVAGAA